MRAGRLDVNDGKREESRGPDGLRRRRSRTDLDEVALVRRPTPVALEWGISSYRLLFSWPSKGRLTTRRTHVIESRA
jgi:hypothetical protein